MTYQVVNRKSGLRRRVEDDEVVDVVAEQHTRNDPAMSHARAREIAEGQRDLAREYPDAEHWTYKVAVSVVE